ncbi:hypothetical protein [Dactylosporangium sp. NPDC051484]|uniref:hypothetical protein n=1 Tax=Dactylosporangium sp. NPDC051484 TaxID=3154942 RepID=UPI00344B86B1
MAEQLRDEAAEILRRLGGNNHEAAQQVAQAMRVFAPLGWVMSRVWPTAGTRAALEAAAAGAGSERIDQILTDVWNGEHSRWLEWGITPLRCAANVHKPLKRDLWRRAELIEAAIRHHHAGAYEASIPILLAQIEGLSYDLVGRAFFPKRDGVEAVDDETLAGLRANIEVARPYYSADVRVRQSEGSLSRHGILHGRELAYDTRVNSTKALTLTLGLVEHWLPVADKLALSQRREHEAAVAGQTGFDAAGRLIDDREVPEVLNTNYWVEAEYMEWISRGQQGEFDVQRALTMRAESDGLTRQRLQLHGDQAGFWWYYQLPGGHVLGWATRPISCHRTPPHDSWWWDQPVPPTTAPWVSLDRWQPNTQLPIPINWQPVLAM